MRWRVWIKKTALIFALLALFVGCSKGGSKDSTRFKNLTASGTANSACNSALKPVGQIFNDPSSTSDGSFEQSVKGLLSALINPQEFGTISGDVNNSQTGVSFEGKIRYGSDGTLLLEQTNLKISVRDSFVGQKDVSGQIINPYVINFGNATSGTVNIPDQSFSVLFKDSYGEVLLQGKVVNQLATGSLSYRNFVHYDGGTPASGELGRFQISACGWWGE